VAEGSTATVGGTEYSYDSNAGWIVPGEGGGGSGGGSAVSVVITNDGTTITAEKTWDEISEAIQAGSLVWLRDWRQARTAFYAGLWDNKDAFVSVYYDQYSQVHFGKYSVDSNNIWTYEELTLPSS